MAMYLNQNNSKFQKYLKNKIFVDKSLLIKETNAYFRAGSFKFMCVTRPRRFGKSLALSMLNAYYSKGCDSRELFKDLAIAKDPSFEKHLNKHNVLWIDLAKVYTGLKDPSLFVDELCRLLIAELAKAHPEVSLEGLSLGDVIGEIKERTGNAFIFLIDEWDVIYREQPNNKKLCDSFTMLLRNLFKSSDISSCFDLVYMTGILPIRRTSSQSGLNVFEEYTMLDSWRLAPFFGFAEDEVRGLCEKRGADFAKIKSWYDGYRLEGMTIYNPISVAKAIEKGRCDGYWTATCAIEALTEYLNYGNGALKGEAMSLLAGEEVKLEPLMFDNDLTKVDSKDAALSVLVHFGYLAYTPDPEGNEGVCRIPNKEIEVEFERAIEMLGWK